MVTVFPLLVIFLFGIGLIVFFVVRRSGSNRASSVDGPTCGKCGQSARGVSSLNCPECGADYREVGIIHPKHRNQGFGVVGRLILFSVGMLIAGGISYGVIIENFAPTSFRYQMTMRFQQPTDPQIGEATINVSARTRVWPNASSSPSLSHVLTLVIYDVNSYPHQLFAQSNGQQFQWQGSPLTVARLRDFMTQATGVPPADAQPYAAEILQEAGSAIQQTAAQVGGSSYSSSSGSSGFSSGGTYQSSSSSAQSGSTPDPYFAGGLGLFMVALWIAGCIWIIRLNSRSTRITS